MTDSRTAPYAALVLRIALGVMFLAHSVLLKLMIFPLPGTAQFFESLGLPAFSAYLVFGVETLGGVMDGAQQFRPDELRRHTPPVAGDEPLRRVGVKREKGIAFTEHQESVVHFYMRRQLARLACMRLDPDLAAERV